MFVPQQDEKQLPLIFGQVRLANISHCCRCLTKHGASHWKCNVCDRTEILQLYMKHFYCDSSVVKKSFHAATVYKQADEQVSDS